jgi:hypothetical protein
VRFTVEATVFRASPAHVTPADLAEHVPQKLANVSRALVNAASAWSTAAAPPPVPGPPLAMRHGDDERFSGLRRTDDIDKRERKALCQYSPERRVPPSLGKRVRAVLHAIKRLDDRRDEAQRLSARGVVTDLMEKLRARERREVDRQISG